MSSEKYQKAYDLIALELNTKYYQKEIEKCDERLSQIKEGKDEEYNKAPFLGKISIKQGIEKHKKELIKKQTKYIELISELKTLIRKMKPIIEKEWLLGCLQSEVLFIKNQSISEECKKMYHELLYGNKKQEEFNQLGISREKLCIRFHELIHENAGNFMLYYEQNYQDRFYSLKDRIENGKKPYTYISEKKQEDGFKTIDDFISILTTPKYNFKYTSINFEKDEIKNSSIGSRAKNIIDKITYYHNVKKEGDTEKIKKLFEEIYNIDCQIEALKIIQKKYEDSIVKETETFKKLTTLISDLLGYMLEKAKEADELYKESDLKQKIDTISNLKELEQQLIQKREELEQEKKQHKNSNESGIDALSIQKIDKLEKEIRDLELKIDMIVSSDKSYRSVLEVRTPKMLIDAEATRKAMQSNTTEEKSPMHSDYQYTITDKQEAHSNEGNTDISNIVMNDERYDDSRGSHYFKYLQENKLRKDNEKIEYSEYLKRIGASKELIELEEQREKRNTFIYVKYIEFILLHEKSNIKFEEFCRVYYQLNNVDIPLNAKELEKEVCEEKIQQASHSTGGRSR